MHSVLLQFNFIETCFVAQDMVHLGELYYEHLKRKMCILLFWGTVFYKFKSDPGGLWHCSSLLNL